MRDEKPITCENDGENIVAIKQKDICLLGDNNVHLADQVRVHNSIRIRIRTICVFYLKGQQVLLM